MIKYNIKNFILIYLSHSKLVCKVYSLLSFYVVVIRILVHFTIVVISDFLHCILNLCLFSPLDHACQFYNIYSDNNLSYGNDQDLYSCTLLLSIKSFQVSSNRVQCCFQKFLPVGICRTSRYLNYRTNLIIKAPYFIASTNNREKCLISAYRPSKIEDSFLCRNKVEKYTAHIFYNK